MPESSAQKTAGLAIASLVMGCFALIPILGLVFSLLAIIFGAVAMSKISRDAVALRGKGLALSGIILGGFGIVIVPIISILLAIAIPSFLRAKDRAQMNQQEMMAVHSEVTSSSAESR